MYGTRAAWAPMNPALYVRPDGSYVLAIRTVNYAKFDDDSFTLFEPRSHTRYWIQRGGDVESLQADAAAAEPLEIEYGQRTVHPTYWTGVEDLRFVNDTTVLVCVPELTSGGHPSLFLATLAATLHSFTHLRPNSSPQKNWMPFGNDFVYQLYPLQVLDQPVRGYYTELKDYHGSTCGVPYKDGWLFLIHKRKEHRWLWLGTSVHVSPPFTFFHHSYIEFCCSLAHYKETYYIGLGVNDASAFIVSVPAQWVDCLTWMELHSVR